MPCMWLMQFSPLDCSLGCPLGCRQLCCQLNCSLSYSLGFQLNYLLSCSLGCQLSYPLSFSHIRQLIYPLNIYTLSGRLAKVVGSHAAVARSIPAAAALIYTTAHEARRCDQSILFTGSDAIVRSWLWSTATRSSPFGYFSILLQVVDN